MKKGLSKLKILGLSTSLIMLSATQKVFADPNSALTGAKTQLQGQATPIVNNVIVPICAVILVIITLVAIVKSVVEYRRGAGVDLGHIVILIVGIILVITFPTWGWGLIN
ncbi:DUF3852 family protein [Clostridium estertheticum]|uniref:Conjugal transfer protein TrbC n=1 Tax=Clostridium estertheticum subsp. estertheticum TaxID=1552 RepID=A0A1J0GNC0_9CLOT|nr:DUF3852 family protein [Clostridium estertheticum]APC42809.1 hypothetical protein A7L45_21970 [Clostridium estertheticum subsp. estertheticum]